MTSDIHGMDFDGEVFRKILESTPNPTPHISVLELLKDNRDALLSALEREISGKHIHRAFIEAGCDVSYSHFMAKLRDFRESEARSGRGHLPPSRQSDYNKRSRNRKKLRAGTGSSVVVTAADSLKEDL